MRATARNGAKAPSAGKRKEGGEMKCEAIGCQKEALHWASVEGALANMCCSEHAQQALTLCGATLRNITAEDLQILGDGWAKYGPDITD